MLGHEDDYELEPTDAGLDIVLGPIGPGDYVLVEVFGTYAGPGDAVLDGSRAVEESTLHRSSFAHPKPWLPNRAIGALGLLLAGLLARDRDLWRRWRRPEPEVALGRAGGTARTPQEPYRS